MVVFGYEAFLPTAALCAPVVYFLPGAYRTNKYLPVNDIYWATELNEDTDNCQPLSESVRLPVSAVSNTNLSVTDGLYRVRQWRTPLCAG